MEENNPLKAKQVDHLILLVGGNPLPNAVSGRVLLKPDGTITLIHSDGKYGTFNIAQNLQNWFTKQGFKPATLVGVRESDADSITMAIQNALKTVSHNFVVGLNYTGGTKAMAVHAYRAMERWAKERLATQPIYTYLDARTLSLIVDPPHPDQGKHYVGRAMKIELDDLLSLHGWSWKEPPTTQPFLPLISEALRQVYLDTNALQIWEKWKQDILIANCAKDDDKEKRETLFIKLRETLNLCNAEEDTKQALEYIEQFALKNSDEQIKWRPNGKLRAIRLPWPTDPLLKDLTVTMQQELGNSNSQLNLAEAAKRCGKDLEDICDWLKGGFWLETVALQTLKAIEHEFHLHSVSMNLLPRLPSSPPKSSLFEFDVIAMRGYQLFAFSCSTDTDSPKNKGGKARLKKRLFEAYIRARQLGGDEARVALVCCADKPDELEREMYRALDAEGRIKVFGQEHLANLTAYLQAWIEEQSKEDV